MNNYYIAHYFNFENAGIFHAARICRSAHRTGNRTRRRRMQMHYHLQTEDLSPRRERQIRSFHLAREYNTIESFFEMVFSSTSILLFLSLYYVIDARIPEAAFYWQKYQDFFLLLFLLCSVVLNGYLDRAFVPLRRISPGQKASVRLVSSFYIVLILLYIKFIYPR